MENLEACLDQDHLSRHAAVLCEQSAALRHALLEIWATTKELQAEARAAQHDSQRARLRSTLLLHALRAARPITTGRLPRD